jgi:glutathione S-transferase
MAQPDSVHRLYGVPHSLYTGIARCYLRTQGIEYLELPTGHPDFASRIMPTIQRSIIPVLEATDGTIVQDSLDIIDHFEGQGVRYSAYPQGLLQSVLGVIIAYYGTQALLPHAMHYRWTYRDQQEGFLRDQFAAGIGPDMADKIMSRMNSYLPQLGVTDHTIPEIEASFEQLLGSLNSHFAEHPYLFGGRPSLADYGLIGPMFAHLGRENLGAQGLPLGGTDDSARPGCTGIPGLRGWLPARRCRSGDPRTPAAADCRRNLPHADRQVGVHG